MSCQDGDADSAEQLLRLIYLHLKENGYQRAARVLKKHISQNETEASATLHEIYTSWIKSSDGAGDTKEESGMDRSPLTKSNLSDYAVEGEDEVKRNKSEFSEKMEEPESEQFIHYGSVSPDCDKPDPSPVVTKSCENSDNHLYSNDEHDADPMQTQMEKATVPQEEEVFVTQDIGIKSVNSDRETAGYSEEEGENLQQQNGAVTLEPTTMKLSVAVAVVSEDQSSDTSEDSKSEEDVPVSIPTEEATAASLKFSQHTTGQAVATPKSQAECSESESSNDLDSEEEATLEQNIMMTPKAKPVSGSPDKASRVSIAVLLKPSYTPDPTTTSSKTQETSNSDDESESEDEIPPTQNADVTPKAEPVSHPANSSSMRTPACVKPGIIPGSTTTLSKTEKSSESDSEEEIPTTQVTATSLTANTSSATPAVTNECQSSDSDSKDAHSDNVPVQNMAVTLKAKPGSDTPDKATTVMTSAPVAPSITDGPTIAPSKTPESSECCDESETEEEVPQVLKGVRSSTSKTSKMIPEKGASVALLKASYHTLVQAEMSVGTEKVSSSEMDGSDDSASKEEADVTPKGQTPVSDLAKETTALMTPLPVTSSFTPGPTTAPSKTGGSTESDDESENEIPPTQVVSSKPPACRPSAELVLANKEKSDSGDSENEEKKAGVTPKTIPLLDPTKITTVRTTPAVKLSIIPSPTIAPLKREESSNSHDKFPPRVASSKSTVNAPSAILAVVNKGDSSDSDNEDAESEEELPVLKPELTTKTNVSKVNPAEMWGVVTPSKTKIMSKALSKASTKSSGPVNKENDVSIDSEDEIPRKPAPALKTSAASVKPVQLTLCQGKAVPSAPSGREKAKKANCDSSNNPSLEKTAMTDQERHEDDDTIDQAMSPTRATVKALKVRSKSKASIATSGQSRDEMENLSFSEGKEEAEKETSVSASDALPKMECRATTQVLQKTSKALKMLDGGSEELSKKEIPLARTTPSDAAPKSPKDSTVEVMVSQTPVNHEDTLKKVRQRRKKKKKKKVFALPEENDIRCIEPAQELVLHNGESGNVTCVCDRPATTAVRVSKQTVVEIGQSKDGASLKKAGSKKSESLGLEENSEEKTGVQTCATAAAPQATKRKRSKEKADSVSKSKKKKSRDAEGNTAEPGKDPYSENCLSLEASKEEAQTLSDESTSKMDLDGAIESTTLILSAKVLKSIKKKMKKNKEKEKVKDKRSKNIKTTLNMKKAKRAFTSVVLTSSWSATKKDLKKAAVKRPLLALDTQSLDEQCGPQKKKKSDKDSTIKSQIQPESPNVKKKNKRKRKEKKHSGKKQTGDTADHDLQNPGVEFTTLFKKKKKKKNRLKDKAIKTQGFGLDTGLPIGTSPEVAKGKVKKSSFKNK